MGFWQEHQAANAVDALKKQLALKARVKRDGQWAEIDAANLVPGDIVRLRLGDIIPADVRLVEVDYLSVLIMTVLKGWELNPVRWWVHAIFSGRLCLVPLRPLALVSNKVWVFAVG